MSFRGLAGKVVVVTGGGQGIGRAYAHRFVDEGCPVVVADLNGERAASVCEELHAKGGRALSVTVDVAQEEDCLRMTATAVAAFGRVDALVNNAAIFSTIKMKPFWELTVSEWDSLMAVNLKGVWLATKAVLPRMREQGGGSIVNISSGVVWIGRPNYLHYVASKGGVVAMTSAMAREAGAFGVRVNAITPGATYTEIPRATVSPEQKAAMVRMQCIQRPQVPDDLVGMVAFLASDDAAFITGQTINIDGGLTHH